MSKQDKLPSAIANMVSSATANGGYGYIKLDNLAEGSYISAEANPSEPACRMSVEEIVRHMETNAERGLDDV